MMNSSSYQIYVNAGLKAGAYHSVPLGDISIGTTLDSQFFIGCAEMWHQLLRADASADLRSASASRDVLPERLMRVVLNHGNDGLTLRVEQGFAEVHEQRLLPGDSSAVQINTPIRIGATELEIRKEPSVQDAQAHGVPNRGSLSENTALAGAAASSLPRWANSKVAMTGLTAVAVLGLSLAIILKAPPNQQDDDGVNASVEVVTGLSEGASRAPSPVAAHDGFIYNDRIVAIVTSEPAFLMTENGVRYDLGSVVDGGFTISQIAADSVEFTRGSQVQSHGF